MSEKFYQLQAELAESRLPPVIKARTLYLVGAWYSVDGYWKIFRKSSSQEFLTREAAEQFGAKLPGGWINVQIVEIRFPGE